MISNWIRSFIKCFNQSFEYINSLLYVSKKKKQFWEIQFDIFDLKFSRFTSSFGFSSEGGIGLQLYSFQIVLWSGVILFSIFCISVVVFSRSVVCSWGVQDQYSWCGLPKVVCFLRGSRSLLWCVVFCNLVWLLSYAVVSGNWM